ncbi:MAG: NADH-quinone oxidoreductase subunit A [Verrucomicrobiota bacterium]
MPSTPADYVPVFLQVAAGIVFAITTLAASLMMGKRGRRTPAKDTPYECGKDPIGPVHSRFSVKFYLVAMLFILFDIEVVVMYPWAVVYREMLHQGPGIFLSMLSFIGILFVGFLYALKKRALRLDAHPGGRGARPCPCSTFTTRRPRARTR